MANNLMELFAQQISEQNYKESWNVAGEKFSLKDAKPDLFERTVRATVVERDQVNADGESFHSRSICLFLGNGDVNYLSLSPQSTLKQGDEVDKETIMLTPLQRTGAAPIFKADGLKKLDF